MTSGGNRVNDFSEIVPTREITTKIEKTFLVRGRGPICCDINSTHLNSALQTGTGPVLYAMDASGMTK